MMISGCWQVHLALLAASFQCGSIARKERFAFISQRQRVRQRFSFAVFSTEQKASHLGSISSEDEVGSSKGNIEFPTDLELGLIRRNLDNEFEKPSNGGVKVDMLGPEISYEIPTKAAIYNTTKHPTRFYSSEQIRQIKQHVNIVQVIDDYANLPQFTVTSSFHGEESAKCICPFHDDKHPSLSIDNARKIYKCFACDAGGDVINFLCHYPAESSLSFREAIQYLVDNYCSPEFLYELGLPEGKSNTKNNVSRQKQFPNFDDFDNHEDLQQLRNKFYLMNAAAASYYFKVLSQSPSATKARGYMMNRGLSPKTVRRVCIGFAPDVYFDRSKGAYSIQNVPNGSLVQLLQMEGFKPNEIVDSGLATIKKRKREEMNQQHIKESINHAESGSRTKLGPSPNSLEYADLIDRFRNRIVIPIWDASGAQVLGFGGRVIEDLQEFGDAETFDDNNANEDHTDSNIKDYVPAKYLNSPESIIFKKKSILFGLHEASKSILDQDTLECIAEKDRTIFLVEGYMDALSMNNVGINNVVSSMGTAVSLDQLRLAAEAVTANQSLPGKLVLLMDNDLAGVGSVKRLCSSNLLIQICREFELLDIVVGTLPGGAKDPDGFIQQLRECSQDDLIAEQFHTVVRQHLSDWKLWYLQQISFLDETVLPSTEKNELLSLTDICDKASSFLASFTTSERSRVVSDFAEWLSKETSDEGGFAEEALKIRYEHDLELYTNQKSSSKLLRKESDMQYMKRNSTFVASSPDLAYFGPWPEAARKPKKDFHNRTLVHLNSLSSKRRPKTPSQLQRVTDGYFGGIQFANPEDAAWISGGNNDQMDRSLLLGRLHGQPKRREKSHLVYFNSNQYGSLSGSVEQDHAAQDPDFLIDSAERALLRTMIEFAPARRAMKMAIKSGMRKTDSGSLFDWTSNNREWLFEKLVDGNSNDSIPDTLQEGGTIGQLYDFLKSAADAPPGAFASLSGNHENCFSLSDQSLHDQTEMRVSDSYIDEETNRILSTYQRKISTKAYDPSCEGELDVFFRTDEIFQDAYFNDSMSNIPSLKENKAEMMVQETLTTLLRASAFKAYIKARDDWEIAMYDLISASKYSDASVNQNKSAKETIDILRDLANARGRELRDAQLVAKELDATARKIGIKLLDRSISSGSRMGVASVSKEELLSEMLDEHIESLKDVPETPGDSGEYIFGFDEAEGKFDGRYGGRTFSAD